MNYDNYIVESLIYNDINIYLIPDLTKIVMDYLNYSNFKNYDMCMVELVKKYKRKSCYSYIKYRNDPYEILRYGYKIIDYNKYTCQHFLDKIYIPTIGNKSIFFNYNDLNEFILDRINKEKETLLWKYPEKKNDEQFFINMGLSSIDNIIDNFYDYQLKRKIIIY